MVVRHGVVLLVLFGWPAMPAQAAPTLAWSRSAAGSGFWSEAYAVAVDAADNVYVGGQFDESTYTSATIRKYAPTGALVWSMSHVGPVGGWDTVTALAVDPTSRVIAAGMENRSDLGEGLNWRVAKYLPTGVEMWSRTFLGTATGLMDKDDRPRAVVTDTAGNSYVTGHVYMAQTGGNVWHAFTVKLDPDGNVVWSRTAGSPPYAHGHSGYGVAVDTSGSVYVGVEDYSTYIHTEIFKYDAAGELVWSRTFPKQLPMYAIPRGFTITNGQELVLTGYVVHDGGAVPWDTDLLVATWDTAGTLLWSRTLTSGSTGDGGAEVTVDDCGGLVVLGTFGPGAGVDTYWILRFTSQGDMDWSVTGSAGVTYNFAEDIAIDSRGRLVVVGTDDAESWFIHSWTPGPTDCGYVTPSTPPTAPPEGPVGPGAWLDRNVLAPEGEATVTVSPDGPGQPAVTIFTASGRLVCSLRPPALTTSGAWRAAWDGTNAEGDRVARGVYLVRVAGAGINRTLKLLVR